MGYSGQQLRKPQGPFSSLNSNTEQVPRAGKRCINFFHLKSWDLVTSLLMLNFFCYEAFKLYSVMVQDDCKHLVFQNNGKGESTGPCKHIMKQMCACFCT